MSRVPGHVSRDDLSSAGMFALVQAARSFDAGRGASFSTYASHADPRRDRRRAARTRLGQPVGTAPRPPGRGRPRPDLHRPRPARRGPRGRGRARHRHLRAVRAPRRRGPRRGGLPAGLRRPGRRRPAAGAHASPPPTCSSSASGSPTCTTRWRTCRSGCEAVVEGYFFRDLPMAEIAAELGVSREPDLAAARRGGGADARRHDRRAGARAGPSGTSAPRAAPPAARRRTTPASRRTAASPRGCTTSHARTGSHIA